MPSDSGGTTVIREPDADRPLSVQDQHLLAAVLASDAADASVHALVATVQRPGESLRTCRTRVSLALRRLAGRGFVILHTVWGIGSLAARERVYTRRVTATLAGRCALAPTDGADTSRADSDRTFHGAVKSPSSVRPSLSGER